MSIDSAVGFTVPQWTVADRFRKARENRGLSQVDFATETGISRRTISAIETGDKVPATKEYNLWQMRTGVPRAWLEFGDAGPSDGPGGTGVHPPGLEPGTH